MRSLYIKINQITLKRFIEGLDNGSFYFFYDDEWRKFDLSSQSETNSG